MSIRISIFDFFSYTIPGFFYIFTFWHLDHCFFNFIHLPWQENYKLDFYGFILLLVLAFIFGLIMDRIVYICWWKRFANFIKEKTFDSIINQYSDRKLNLKLNEYLLYRTYVANNNKEFGDMIDRYDATAIMLQNISFSIFILGIVEIAMSVKHFLQLSSLILSFLLFAFSILSIIEAKKYRSWAITGVLNFMITSNISFESIVEKKRIVEKRHREKGL